MFKIARRGGHKHSCMRLIGAMHGMCCIIREEAFCLSEYRIESPFFCVDLLSYIKEHQASLSGLQISVSPTG
jgi:hypothetical protein